MRSRSAISERFDDFVAIEVEPVEVELDTLEERRVAVAGTGIDILLGVDDVAVVVGEEPSRGSDHAWLVGTREQEDSSHGPGFTAEVEEGAARGRSTRPPSRRPH